MREAYEIRYAQEAAMDIRGLRSRIKAMRQPFWSQYRLRIDDFRVYYDVSETPRAVSVLRVLEKTTQGTPEKPT